VATGQLLHTASLPGSHFPSFHFAADNTVTIATYKESEADVQVWRLPLTA
jgi:hypothetical protein